MKHHYAIIMAGGVGTRFWPMSTTQHPKQFLDILGTGQTLLQQTYDRVAQTCPIENIFVVTSNAYEKLVAEQLPKLLKENILCESARKNTAPCIAYASYKIHKRDPKAITLVAPSDHLVKKEDTFVKAIKSCFDKAKQQDCLITLGIKPTRPDTGYGYIQFIKSDVEEKDKRINKVKTFTEKPDAEMANFFMDSGDFLWNSGIFIWSTESIISAMEKHDPELANVFKEGWDFYNTDKEKEFVNRAYATCKNISIDYSVMEKAKNVYVRSSIFGWSDLGTWGSLYTQIKKDDKNNALVGKNIITYDCNNCIVQVPKDKLVVLQGLEDYIVVESEGVLMICKKQDEQQIRNFVNDVKVSKGEKFV
ncbi:mannose-1-phosphate guanylyltransferase [Aurantibacillus circumpalustris]|uniref:mannose-1-phosphate guanylyltransferase n=1 Tax=Aurantibacillus circumpalustris TaxID=3036359 RepID=UPI00295AD923|nr:mannose-1-phosphate guanylyltransferase [Aurantibacillus circumpalustris]